MLSSVGIVVSSLGSASSVATSLSVSAVCFFEDMIQHSEMGECRIEAWCITYRGLLLLLLLLLSSPHLVLGHFWGGHDA